MGESKLENREFKRYNITELKLSDEDLQMLMTMGLVVGGSWLDLLSLKNYIGKLPNFKVVYNTISTTRLRIVKVEEYELFMKELKRGYYFRLRRVPGLHAIARIYLKPAAYSQI